MTKIIALVLMSMGIPFIGHAQGTLRFVTGDLESGPFIYNLDVGYDANFRGQILAGPSPDSLSPVGMPARFGLLDGTPNAQANGLILDGSILSAPTVAPGENGFYQLQTWCDADGSLGTYASAVASGSLVSQWSIVSARFGDVSQGVPTPNTDGFQSGTLLARIDCVPEPSVVALGVLGIVGLAQWKRRRKTIVCR